MSTPSRQPARADWRVRVRRALSGRLLGIAPLGMGLSGPRLIGSGLMGAGLLAMGLLGLGLLGLPESAQAQNVSRIGYVDMQRLIDSAPQVAEARERLAREFAVRDNLLKTDEARFNELTARLNQTPDVLPPSERARLIQEAEALQRLITRTRGQLAEELNARSREEVDKAWPQISAAVADFARENNYDLVVNSPVLYVSGRIDITEQVLAYLRARADEDARP